MLEGEAKKMEELEQTRFVVEGCLVVVGRQRRIISSTEKTRNATRLNPGNKKKIQRNKKRAV